MSRRSREEWKRTLEPWARLYGASYRAASRHLEGLTDERLNDLQEAIKQPSQTNCGWDVYGAAKFIAGEVAVEVQRRAREAERIGPWVDARGYTWQLADDGLMHSPETIPFERAYIEKKWGPLRPASEADGSR